MKIVLKYVNRSKQLVLRSMMKAQDYPVLYNACSFCADKNQKNHYRIIKVRIVLLITIALLGGIVWKQIPEVGIMPPLIIAISFLIMFIFTIIMENKKFEKTWQISRAGAEWIKQASWLYMMRANPYVLKGGQDAKVEFMNLLRKIIDSMPISDIPCNLEGGQITTSMDKVRNGDLEERKQFYIQSRIEDQRRWYSRKAEFNHTRESQFTLLMWLFLAAGVAFSFLNVVFSAMEISLPLNAIGIATTSSASILSWISARSYKELSHSYSAVAYELSFIEENARNASTEDQLTKVVEEAERVMGQEQELWKTKRLIKLR
jgi:hypothetical protein